MNPKKNYMDPKKISAQKISAAKKLLTLTEELCKVDAVCVARYENNDHDIQCYNSILEETSASFFKIIEKLK